MVRRRSIGWQGLVAAITLLSSAPSPVLGQSDGRWKSGEEIYNKVCGYCHETGVGPVIRGRDYPPQAYGTFVRHGPLAMPSFRSSEIDEQALQSLGEFLSASGKRGQLNGDPERPLAFPQASMGARPVTPSPASRR